MLNCLPQKAIIKATKKMSNPATAKALLAAFRCITFSLWKLSILLCSRADRGGLFWFEKNIEYATNKTKNKPPETEKKDTYKSENVKHVGDQTNVRKINSSWFYEVKKRAENCKADHNYSSQHVVQICNDLLPVFEF